MCPKIKSPVSLWGPGGQGSITAHRLRGSGTGSWRASLGTKAAHAHQLPEPHPGIFLWHQEPRNHSSHPPRTAGEVKARRDNKMFSIETVIICH